MPVSRLEAGAGHLLAQAALLEKILFQSPQLPVQQVVGLVDQAEGDVGHHFAGASFHKFAIRLIGRLGITAQFARILRLAGGFVPIGSNRVPAGNHGSPPEVPPGWRAPHWSA